MSFCCIPRTALKRLGREPFRLRLCEDGYFCHRLAPLGDVVYSTAPMVAYRIRSGSLSSDWMRVNSAEVEALERLEPYFEALGDRALSNLFRRSLAIKKRRFARALMGANRAPEARRQLTESFRSCPRPASAAKSSALLLATYLPPKLQPVWPASGRDPRLKYAR